LIHDPSDYLIYYAIIVGAAILNLIWNFFRLFGEIRPTFKNIGWKKHLPVLLTTYRISLVYSVVLMLDNVFLRIVSTSAAVAYYAFGVKVLRIAGALVTDVLLVLYPRTVSMVSQERMDDVQRTISQTSQLIFLTTIPMGVGIFLTAEPLTFSYFGRNFEPVIENLKILCFYPLIKSTGLFLNKQLLMPFDRERQVLRSLEISVIIFVCLAIPLSYQYADKGMSVAVIVSEVAVVALNYYFARKLKLNLRLIDWESAAHAFFGTLLFFPVTWAINSSIDNMLTKLIVQVISCIFVYLLFLVFIIRNTLVISCLQSCKDAIILSKRAKNETR
jgi:O-antigen/teichoic acid export membrane protein